MIIEWNSLGKVKIISVVDEYVDAILVIDTERGVVVPVVDDDGYSEFWYLKLKLDNKQNLYY